MSIATGTRLGQYEVQDFIGQGAMGVIYRAYHSELERTGAVKVMQAITPDPDTVARFRHEAQAIARLRHPNIVDVYDFGEFQGTPYMIVEYIPGGSLAGKMSHEMLDQQTTLRYLRGIAAGLDYAHGHGVVHRDVKPANVLLAADDSPVLADFGLAKLMQGSSLKSMTGVTTGTPAYMAPEQVTGGQVGPAADRYSLATIAYEMLTGVIPFDGEALMELLYAQVHRHPQPPSARQAALGPAVDAAIMRGLAKNPTERWESCAAFVDALEDALASEPAPAAAATMVMATPAMATNPIARTAVAERPAQPATVAMEYPSPPVATVTPPAATPKRSRRRLLLGIAAVLILLLVLGVCAVVAQATTLTVNPTRVAPGGTVTVTATHVPANQAGEIQLWSVVHTYPFRAKASGEVSQDITVPGDTDLGNHIVKICWDNSCHKEAPLRVVSGVAEASPTPAANNSPVPSSSAPPSGSPRSSPSPTPRTSPTPGSTPRSTATPTSIPQPSPSPSPTPNPTISVTPTTVHILTSRDITVTGTSWPSGSTVTITFIQTGLTKQIGNQNVQSNGAFSWTGGIPSSALPGTATIRVCAGSTCRNATILVAT
ncbi:MAG: serine/threonine protein kinase [Chloroflexi bacterium]|nr:MAG: serine/threonine protein kinase [Chloroflexota bacterium]